MNVCIHLWAWQTEGRRGKETKKEYEERLKFEVSDVFLVIGGDVDDDVDILWWRWWFISMMMMLMIYYGSIIYLLYTIIICYHHYMLSSYIIIYHNIPSYTIIHYHNQASDIVQALERKGFDEYKSQVYKDFKSIAALRDL